MVLVHVGYLVLPVFGSVRNRANDHLLAVCCGLCLYSASSCIVNPPFLILLFPSEDDIGIKTTNLTHAVSFCVTD
ncbi:hypothetical protein AGIG_G21393 [Arapaima gigas]